MFEDKEKREKISIQTNLCYIFESNVHRFNFLPAKRESIF